MQVFSGPGLDLLRDLFEDKRIMRFILEQCPDLNKTMGRELPE